MKILKFLSLLTLIIALPSACADNNDEAARTDMVEKSSALVVESCLADYVFEPCSFFSLEEMASLTQLPASLGTLTEPRASENSSRMACLYEWESERTMTVDAAGMTIEVPVEDKMIVGSFSTLDPEKINEPFIDYFNKRYSAPTEEAQQKFDQAFEEKLENESTLTQDVGNAFAGLAKRFEYSEVNGLADAASWETNPTSTGGTLHVLHKNVNFHIAVDLSDDSEYNLEMAKKIVSPIIQKCD